MGRHFDVHKICLFTYLVERKHFDRTSKSYSKALRDNTKSHVAQRCWIIILKYIDSPKSPAATATTELYKIINNKPDTDCTKYRAGLRSDVDLKKKTYPILRSYEHAMVSPYYDYRKTSSISRTKVENECVVGAAPTGDAPTTSEWSASSVPTKVRLILEVWRCLWEYRAVHNTARIQQMHSLVHSSVWMSCTQYDTKEIHLAINQLCLQCNCRLWMYGSNLYLYTIETVYCASMCLCMWCICAPFFWMKWHLVLAHVISYVKIAAQIYLFIYLNYASFVMSVLWFT